MKLSIIIACHNEGHDLEATIAQCVRLEPSCHEIVVVDDCSNPEVKTRLTSPIFRKVKVIRTPEQKGAGMAKKYGCDHAKGDVFLILDSHMNVPLNAFGVIEDAVKKYPKAVFCTVCHDFRVGSKFEGAGARFNSDKDLFFGRSWLKRGNPDDIDICPCLLGAAYIVPKCIWDNLGGMNPNFYGWGYGEQDISWRAWMYGYEVRRINRMVIQHKFNRTLPKSNSPVGRLSSWHNSYNALVTAATVFEDGVFEKHYEPFMRRAFRSPALSRFDANRKAIMEFRREVQKRRKLSDSEVRQITRYEIPSIEHQEKICRKIGKKSGKSGKPLMGETHIRAIVDAIPPNGSMLEWGPGYTTIEFRNRLNEGQSILSIEHNRSWSHRIPNVILHEMDQPIGRPEAEYRDGQKPCVGQDLPYVRAVEDGQKFDVILVDGTLRNACLIRAKELLNPGGTVFLHDAQRDWYEKGREGYEVVQEWAKCPDYPGPTLVALRPIGHADRITNSEVEQVVDTTQGIEVPVEFIR